MTWKQLQQAYKLLSDQNIKGVLMGTAGLWALGFNVDAHDIDFLVEKQPEKTNYLPESDPKASISTYVLIDGTMVHYVPVYASKYTPKALPERFQTINDIPIMNTDEILELKRTVGRTKDIEFLKGWFGSERRADYGQDPLRDN